MKKAICLVMVCILMCAMAIPAFAAESYQIGTLKFTTDVELTHSYSESEMLNPEDDDWFEFESDALGSVTYEDDEAGEITAYGELEIEATKEDGSSKFEELKNLWGDDVEEITIDGCPAIVYLDEDEGEDPYAQIYTYDDTYVYCIELEAYDKAGFDELYDDILNAELNCAINSDDVADDSKAEDDKDAASEDKTAGENNAENDKAETNDKVATNGAEAKNDNTLIIVIGVVAVAAIAAVVVVMLKKKK